MKTMLAAFMLLIYPVDEPQTLAETYSVTEALYENFEVMPLEEKKRIVHLGMNANWVIMRFEMTELDSQTQELAKPWIDALTMGMENEGR